MQWEIAGAGASLGLGAWPLVERLARWSMGDDLPRPNVRRRVGLAVAFAAALAVVGGRVGLRLALPAFVVFAVVAMALCAVDLTCHRLPDRLTLPSYAVGVALLAIAAGADSLWADLLRAVASALALFGCYLLLRLVSPGQLGRGDVKYAGVVGLHLGWFGWSTVAVGAVAGFIVGGLVSLALVATRRAGLRTRVAFGPSMVAGAVLAIALGPAANDGLLLWAA